ncbi:Carbohydrate binding domain (family 25) [Halobacteroides halobius DSM 5150]|uniref:Carbohydrate binding domain (Family 25) n=1 Tax=Halobacteroides halobius (strain ATCC 35273 / DSM 5150 / MD-1) TaxID=748449 RepID=L0KD42_HALHC|nr:carbohydrate-binding protein [Halobacteroides halobius]AGB42003.1 Carbohydrate binding domain (family 25) [Halobacteroides halobius DSM 5150]
MEDNGVQVNPTPITAGERITINYQGLLAQSGADQVYLHAGVGMGDNWQDVTNIQMKQEQNGDWVAQLRINSAERFNFCFKDSAENWDNNSGNNWSYEVHNGDLYTQ